MVEFRAFFHKLTETNVLVTQLYKIDTQMWPTETCTTENQKKKGAIFSNADIELSKRHFTCQTSVYQY